MFKGKLKLGALALTLVGAFALSSVPVSAADPLDESQAVVDFIFEIKPGEDPEHWADVILEELDVPPTQRESRLIYIYEAAINGLWLRLTPSEVDEIQDLKPEIASGIVNMQQSFKVSVPVEPQAAMNGSGYGGPQVVPTGFQRMEGVLGDYSEVDIAVLDTGVDGFHDDLNVAGGFDCTFEGSPDEWNIDGFGHGTHVAGIAAGIDNDRFVVGPAAGARIWSYKVLGSDGSGSMASVLCGIDQVAKVSTTIDVVNLSLGGGNLPSNCNSWDSLHNGICNLVAMGVTVVVSAGNDARDAINSSPANYPEAVTVSALADFDGLPGGLEVQSPDCAFGSRDDSIASFSNYGSLVDFIAPGVCIYSTLPGNTAGFAAGTSMAAPEVTGVIAAWISQNLRHREHAFEAVYAWSKQVWLSGTGSLWTGDPDSDHEPLVRFGAPSWEDLVDRGLVEASD